MPKEDIIAKLEKAGLSGRGGAAYPTFAKWQSVKNEKSFPKYVVANGSEGEPNVLKDGYILEHYARELVEGIKIALKYLGDSSAFLFLRKDYFQKYQAKLKKIIGKSPIKVFREKGGYLSGEETVLCQEIENQLARPRSKPPYPGQAGIFGQPTLINNIETFYQVSQIAKNKYQNTRFYTISGAVAKPGVYELPEIWSIKKVLTETGNWPSFDFFVQSGGGASGAILLASELNKPVTGSGAIIVFDKKNTDLYKLMLFWVRFFMRENCDKCTPCREGTYRLEQMLQDKKLDLKKVEDLMFVLENTSFCALGKSVVVPFRSLLAKIKVK